MPKFSGYRPLSPSKQAKEGRSPTPDGISCELYMTGKAIRISLIEQVELELPTVVGEPWIEELLRVKMGAIGVCNFFANPKLLNRRVLIGDRKWFMHVHEHIQ